MALVGEVEQRRQYVTIDVVLGIADVVTNDDGLRRCGNSVAAIAHYVGNLTAATSNMTVSSCV